MAAVDDDHVSHRHEGYAGPNPIVYPPDDGWLHPHMPSPDVDDAQDWHESDPHHAVHYIDPARGGSEPLFPELYGEGHAACRACRRVPARFRCAECGYASCSAACHAGALQASEHCASAAPRTGQPQREGDGDSSADRYQMEFLSADETPFLRADLVEPAKARMRDDVYGPPDEAARTRAIVVAELAAVPRGRSGDARRRALQDELDSMPETDVDRARDELSELLKARRRLKLDKQRDRDVQEWFGNVVSVQTLDELIETARERVEELEAMGDSEQLRSRVNRRWIEHSRRRLEQMSRAPYRPPVLIGARDEVRIVTELVYYPFVYQDTMARAAVRPPNVLLYGPGGTGKTLLARSTASTVNAPFFQVSASDVQSSFQGKSKRNFALLLRTVRAAASATGDAQRGDGALLFLDEAEALIGDVRANDAIDTNVASEFKALVQPGVGDGANLVIFAATNFPQRINDAAVLSRFQLKLYTGLPGDADRVALVRDTVARRYSTSQRNMKRTLEALVARQVDLVAATRGYTQRELTEGVRLFVSRAISQRVGRTRFRPLGVPTMAERRARRLTRAMRRRAEGGDSDVSTGPIDVAKDATGFVEVVPADDAERAETVSIERVEHELRSAAATNIAVEFLPLNVDALIEEFWRETVTRRNTHEATLQSFLDYAAALDDYEGQKRIQRDMATVRQARAERELRTNVAMSSPR